MVVLIFVDILVFSRKVYSLFGLEKNVLSLHDYLHFSLLEILRKFLRKGITLASLFLFFPPYALIT